jgi:hypothetical protein
MITKANPLHSLEITEKQVFSENNYQDFIESIRKSMNFIDKFDNVAVGTIALQHDISLELAEAAGAKLK